MAANNNSALILHSVIEEEKSDGANFIDWHHNLRIVLKNEKKEYVTKQHAPMTFLMVQIIQPAKLTRSTATIHSISVVSCLPQYPQICRSIVRMLMLTL